MKSEGVKWHKPVTPSDCSGRNEESGFCTHTALSEYAQNARSAFWAYPFAKYQKPRDMVESVFKDFSFPAVFEEGKKFSITWTIPSESLDEVI